jgi:carboxyl-terminal processing protease
LSRRPLPALLLLFLLLSGAPAPASTIVRYDTALNAKLFDRIWSLTERRYWDRGMRGLDWAGVKIRFRPQVLAARDEAGVYAVLNAMLDTLNDSHVYALPPSRLRQLGSRPVDGEALGLGFVAVEEGGGWRISSVSRGSPAAAAGVRIGWRLVSVDGRPVDTGYQPPDGAIVTLALEDDRGVPRAVRLRPSEYESQPEWRAAPLGGGVLLLTIDGFDRGADQWVVRQLSAAPRPAGVIVDLRENGGGASDVLDRIAGAFFLERRVVLRLGGRREEREWTRGAGARAFNGPLVVMVGPRTASAAEAFAALIEESGRGTVVGERTAGRLTGAVHHRLPDGGELSLAQYDVRTASGRRLEGQGLLPRHLLRTTLKEAVLLLAQRLVAQD